MYKLWSLLYNNGLFWGFPMKGMFWGQTYVWGQIYLGGFLNYVNLIQFAIIYIYLWYDNKKI